MDKPYEIETVRLPGGRIYPAIQVNGVFLTHPQLNSKWLNREYEKAILAVLETPNGVESVKKAINSRVQLMLQIGPNWKAPMSVWTNQAGQVVALLHYF